MVLKIPPMPVRKLLFDVNFWIDVMNRQMWTIPAGRLNTYPRARPTSSALLSFVCWPFVTIQMNISNINDVRNHMPVRQSLFEVNFWCCEAANMNNHGGHDNHCALASVAVLWSRRLSQSESVILAAVGVWVNKLCPILPGDSDYLTFKSVSTFFDEIIITLKLALFIFLANLSLKLMNRYLF